MAVWNKYPEFFRGRWRLMYQLTGRVPPEVIPYEIGKSVGITTRLRSVTARTGLHSVTLTGQDPGANVAPCARTCPDVRETVLLADGPSFSS